MMRAMLLALLACPCMGLRQDGRQQIGLENQIRFQKIEDLTENMQHVLPQKPRDEDAKSENLMEVRAKPPSSCPRSSEVWTPTGHTLGQGQNGRVIEVTGSVHLFAAALKEPLGPSGAADARKEVEVMRASMKMHCKNVMTFTAATPCVQDSTSYVGSVQPDSYVAPEMTGDLDKWLRRASISQMNFCAQSILKQVASGMTCLHAAGYIHGDLKADNIFYKDYDIHGCPDGVVLADFGLARQVFTEMNRFPEKYYIGSHHLPASVFMMSNGDDPLHLNIPERPGRCLVSRRIDRCSYLLMAYEYFRLNADTPEFGLKPGDCGFMGDGRRIKLPLASR